MSLEVKRMRRDMWTAAEQNVWSEFMDWLAGEDGERKSTSQDGFQEMTVSTWRATIKRPSAVIFFLNGDRAGLSSLSIKMIYMCFYI
jgi:hypothetical protein